jgi:hypothetical protein
MILHKETVGFYVLLFIIGSVTIVLINQYFSGDQIEKNEVGGACNTYGGDERRIDDFSGKT